MSSEEGESKSRKVTKTKKTAGKKNSGVKRARSAYIFFAEAVRPIVKQENPEIAFGELSKAVGAQWKALGDTDKRQYQELAQQDKERYEREFAAAGGAGSDGNSD